MGDVRCMVNFAAVTISVGDAVSLQSHPSRDARSRRRCCRAPVPCHQVTRVAMPRCRARQAGKGAAVGAEAAAAAATREEEALV